MIVLCENIFNIMAILRVCLLRLMYSCYYFNAQGRSEIIKKYGFIPPRSQLIASSSDSDSSSSDEDHGSMINFLIVLTFH